MVDGKSIRRNWAPLLRIFYQSGMDIAADWFFYASIRDSEDPLVDKYVIYLFIFFVVSAVMAGLTIFGVVVKGCAPNSSLGRQLNKILALETIIGDVPQIVLTALITHDTQGLDFYGAINFATSVYNIIGNALEACGNPADDEEFEEEEEYEDQVIIDEKA